MRKRYVVCLSNSKAAESDAFSEFIKQKGLAWWHWLGDSWLLVDSSGTLSAEEVRAKAKECFPDAHNLVLELRGDSANDTWAGFGPSTENKNMFKWLKDYW